MHRKPKKPQCGTKSLSKRAKSRVRVFADTQNFALRALPMSELRDASGKSASHLGVEENERAYRERDRRHHVREQRSVRDMWAELWLGEMSKHYSEGALSGGSQPEEVGWEEWDSSVRRLYGVRLSGGSPS